MNSALKIVLIICAVVLLLAAIIGGGTWFWWKNNAAEMMTASKAAMAQGQKSGGHLDEAGCLNEALARYKADSDHTIKKSVVDSFWLKACLLASQPLEKFCQDVPPKDALVQAGVWAGLACSQQGLSDPYCPNVLKNVVNYCSSPARADKLAHTVPQPPSKK